MELRICIGGMMMARNLYTNEEKQLRLYKNRSWTEEEKEYLKEHFPYVVSYLCAKKLDRSITAVQSLK